MHSFFCDNISVAGAQVQLSERDTNHLFRTLRGRVGDKIKLIDGCGKAAIADIIEHKAIKLNEVTVHHEPAIKLHLLVAPPRRQKMDSLLKQCAEIGVWEITPIISERSVALPGKKKSSCERWETLLMEGCKQAENVFLPQINEPQPLIDILMTINCSKSAVFFGETPLEAEPDCLVLDGCSHIIWIVGPEGGFTDEERHLLKKHGAQPFSFGDWILRVETAAICGAAILMRQAKISC